MDITTGNRFIGLCDEKKVYINMCPILGGRRVMAAGNLE
jgi:hypothetical protein